MFGKYFKHVVALTLLAGVAYSLPQVKDAMVGAFGFADSNDALVINYKSSASQIRREMPRPIVQAEREIMKGPERREVPPAEIIAILVKANVIPREKAEIAVKILKEQLDKRDKENASSTRATMMQNASTTRQMMRSISSTTPPVPRMPLENI